MGRESRWEYGEQYAGRLFSEKGTRLFPGSTGVGDDAVQAYDYRVCLTDNPDNLVPIPNDKYDLNTADLPGGADDYPEGDRETRRAIAKEHRNHVLGLVYFFQHDEGVTG